VRWWGKKKYTGATIKLWQQRLGGGNIGQQHITVAMDDGVSLWQQWTTMRKQGGKGNKDNTTRQ
jgi:hypothetical protein